MQFGYPYQVCLLHNQHLSSFSLFLSSSLLSHFYFYINYYLTLLLFAPSFALFCPLFLSQYSQAPRMSKLCLANFGFRLALNKILPYIFSLPAYILVSRCPNMTYKEVRQTQ